MLKASAIWLNRLLWAAIVSALIVVASYVSIGRHYIEYVDDYQAQLVQRFVSYTGLPLTVGHLSGRWVLLSPVLTMQQLTLFAPGGEEAVLTLDEVSFQIDALNTLIHRDLRIAKLSINGVHSSLLETSPGRWQLKGYPIASDGTASDFDTVFDLVLSARGADLTGAHVNMGFHNGKDADLLVRELSLHRDDEFRRLRLLANLNQSNQPLISIVEAQGDPRELDEFSAKAYLKLRQVDFTAYLPAMRALGIELQKAVFDGELWVDWRPGTEIDAQAYISTPYLDIAAFSGEQLAPLRDLELTLRLEKTEGFNWRAWVPLFKTQWQGEQLVFEKMAMEVTESIAYFSIPTLSVDQAVKHLLAVNLLADPEQELVEVLSPAGQLNNLHASLSRLAVDGAAGDDTAGNDTHPRFSMRANLANVSIEPWQGAPGAKGVSGYIEVQPLTGMVELDAENMALEFPTVYHHGLSFDSALGQVQWQIDQDSVKVNSGPLALSAQFGPATGLLSLDLPLKKDSGTPTMNLSIGIRNAGAESRQLLIPYTLNPNFLEWMAGSVPSGHVIEGGFIYRGSLLADGALDRTVQLFFDIDNTVLDFHTDWPPLTDISGLVMIDDAAVNVSSENAKMFGLNVNSAVVSVSPVDDGLWLQINAQASGGAGDALRIVNNSMIDRLVGGAFNGWELSGNAAADIDLGIPLAGSKQPQALDVNVELDSGQLAIPDFRIELTELGGALHYGSRSGITSTDLEAKLYAKPLTATVSQAEQGAVSVDIRGRADMRDVEAWTGRPSMTFASGETDFDARVYIAGKTAESEAPAKHSEFSVHSQLQGVAIDLPAPYGKAAEQQRSFWLRQPLTGGAGPLRLGIEDQVELQVQFEQGRATAGLVMLGGLHEELLVPGLFTVTGEVEQFDLDQWQPVLNRYLEKSRQLASEEDTQQGLDVAVSQLRIATFSGFSQRITDSIVDMRRRNDSWWLSIMSPMVDGEMLLPDDRAQPLLLRLDKLKLPADALSSAEEREGGLASIKLAELEQFSAYVAIADWWVGEERYGSINFELYSEPSKLQLRNLGGYIRGVRIGIKQPAYFEWLISEEGEQSRLYGDFDFSDFGDVMELWKYERFLESDYGMGSLDLSWAGRPDQWQLKSSRGPIFIKFKDGRFLKASDTATGTLKVVGVVNLMNVVRRLRLDFSDLYEEGVSFDRIEGEALLGDGQLVIADKLEIKSPSSRFHLRGKADLEQEALDMDLVVTLPVASNLPWIFALAGGLPTAAGVYVASKLFEEQFDRLSSAMYTVEGDWNDPEMNFKRVFDDTSRSPAPDKLPVAADESLPAAASGVSVESIDSIKEESEP